MVFTSFKLWQCCVKFCCFNSILISPLNLTSCVLTDNLCIPLLVHLYGGNSWGISLWVLTVKWDLRHPQKLPSGLQDGTLALALIQTACCQCRKMQKLNSNLVKTQANYPSATVTRMFSLFFQVCFCWAAIFSDLSGCCFFFFFFFLDVLFCKF